MNILVLCGKSGSGKTTIGELMAEQLSLNFVKTKTTKQRRNTRDRSHIFTSKMQYEKDKKYNNIICETVYGKDIYWCTKELLMKDRVNILVVDKNGIDDLLKTSNKVLVIYMDADKEKRKERITKEMGAEKAKERLERDENGFYEYIKADYIVNANNRLQIIYNQIYDILKVNKYL